MHHNEKFSGENTESPEHEVIQPDTNPYDILGVKEDASDEDIKRTFHKKAKDYHPDKIKELRKCHPEYTPELLEQKFKEINSAYDILKNKEGQRKNKDLCEETNLADIDESLLPFIIRDQKEILIEEEVEGGRRELVPGTAFIQIERNPTPGAIRWSLPVLYYADTEGRIARVEFPPEELARTADGEVWQEANPIINVERLKSGLIELGFNFNDDLGRYLIFERLLKTDWKFYIDEMGNEELPFDSSEGNFSF